MNRVQTNIVVVGLMQCNDMTREDALKLWLKSKTKHIIQDEAHLDWVSGARCYDELQLELKNDPSWMNGSFD